MKRYSYRPAILITLVLSLSFLASDAWADAASVAMRLGETIALALSNESATVEPSAPPVSDEAGVYEWARHSVFRVEASAGHGTGFLVDASGLVLTNYHVVKDARYIGVQIDPENKFPGEVVATDATHDLAVIRIHPETVDGIEVLELVSTPGDVSVGTRVLAIGNPLTEESVLTIGIVGKVEETALISDVNVNPGNSGGPILDLQGRVLAVVTFGLQAEQGPGISGAVLAHVATGVLAEARGRLVASTPPPATRLPVVPSVPYPVEALRSSVTLNKEALRYNLEAGKFKVQVLTPVAIFHQEHAAEIKAARRQEKRRNKRKKKHRQQGLHDPAGDLFEWQRYAGLYDPVVSVVVLPEVKETGGSKAGRIFAGLFGVATGGKYRFKRDFREMRLLRDGELVRPIYPGRSCEAVSIEGYGSLNDIGCMGGYQYAPEVFAPGHSYRIEVYSEEEPDKAMVADLDGALLARIRRDFRAYFETVAAAATIHEGQDAVTAEVVGGDGE